MCSFNISLELNGIHQSLLNRMNKLSFAAFNLVFWNKTHNNKEASHLKSEEAIAHSPK